MKTKIAVAISILLAICAVGYSVYLRNQIFWWKDSLSIHAKMNGICQAKADSKSGIYRLWEKVIEPNQDEKYLEKKDGSLEVWGRYYRPLLGEYEKVAVEGYIEGYNSIMRKERKKLEANKTETKQ